uniref:RRM domain-containing protein n=2 Tax=Macrostomum lignano TaxID=282301 RepID=A0A1I8G5Z1_9PLAT
MQASSSAASVPTSDSSSNSRMSSTRIFIRGLSPGTTDLKIRQLIAHEAGVPDHSIVFAQTILDSQSGQCKGTGFAEFRNAERAKMAVRNIQQLQATKHASQGQLKVEFAREAEKDGKEMFVWNLPVNCTMEGIRQFLLYECNCREDAILSFRTFRANPYYSTGLVKFKTEFTASRVIQLINHNGLRLSHKYGCSGRLAAKFSEKKTRDVGGRPVCLEDIVKPSAHLLEITKEPLELKDAENPFKWCAYDGSDKNIEDVIDTILDRLKLEPMLSSAYHGLLAAYHGTRFNRRKHIDFRKSREYLKSAVDYGKDADEGHVRCEFVLQAIELNLDAKQSRNQLNFTERVKALNKIWNTQDEAKRIEIRANVFHVKALDFFHQGIKKYDEAEEAVKASLSLRPDNFMCIYLLAYIRARVRRHHNNRTPADAEELFLWNRAYDLANEHRWQDKNEGTKMYFYQFLINYAEAILNNRSLEDKCLELANATLAMLAEEKKEDERCEELLIRAQELSYEPGHIWVDIYYQNFKQKRSDKFSAVDILNEYDTLAERYHQDYPRYEAVCLYSKGAFMMTFSETESVADGFEEMVKAVQVYPEVRVHIHKSKKDETLKNLSQKTDRCEFEAWFQQHMLDLDLQSDEPQRIVQLYTEALNSENSDHQLVYEHLGLLYFRLRDFQAAEENFRKLQSENPRRNSLLSSALLKRAESRDEAEKRDLIVEALRLGNPEACQPARLLLDNRLDHQRRFPLEAIKQKYCPEDPESEMQIVPWLFSKDSYELLALISIASEKNYENYSKTSPLVQTDLRKSRLALERLEQLGKQTESEYYNAIMETLKLAKSAMDGLTAKLDGYEMEKKLDYFPYGFRYMTVKKDETKKVDLRITETKPRKSKNGD